MAGEVVSRLSIGIREGDPFYPFVASYTKHGNDRKVSASSYSTLKGLFVESDWMPFEDFQKAVSNAMPTVHKYVLSSDDMILVSRLEGFIIDAITDGVEDQLPPAAQQPAKIASRRFLSTAAML